MTVFYQEEEQRSHTNRCKDLAAALKDAFMYCGNCKGGKLPVSVQEDEHPTSDFDDEQEVMVSEIRSRAMEKLKQKPKIYIDGFYWVFSDSTKEPNFTSKGSNEKPGDEEDGDGSEFLSVGSCLSECSTTASKEAFMSAKSELSRCCSINAMLEFENPWRIYLQDCRNRSVIQELCHCQGWPFGLGRKAVLLPPPPKSPSESWSWRKRTRIVKTPCI